MTLRKGIVRLLALAVSADEQAAQPHDVLEVCARLAEPVGAQDAAYALLVLGEQRPERLFADCNCPDRGLAVTVQVAEIVEMAAELVQCATRLEQVVTATHLSEYRQDAIE